MKWSGTNYEIISNTGNQTFSISDTTVASVKVTSIDSTIDNNLKLSASNGGIESINGYQIGIVANGSLSASQITFPINTENTTAKTTLGIDASIKNIEGNTVTNNPTNREYFDVDIQTRHSLNKLLIFCSCLLCILYLIKFSLTNSGIPAVLL